MSEITPTGVVTAAAKWIWVAVIAAVLIAGVTVGLWQAGWWFTARNVNRTDQVIQNSYASQTALHQEAAQEIGSVYAITAQMAGTSGQQEADLKAQRLAVAGTACQNAALVSAAAPLPASERAWTAQNCSAGNVSPGSPLHK